MTAPSILAAKSEAVAARADLTATLAELQARVAPRKLAHDAWDTVRQRGEELADQGSHFAKRQPGAAAGIVAGLAVLLLRKPLGRGIRRLCTRKPKSGPASPPFNPVEMLHTAQSIKQETLP